jgi:predicted tellurium resistance membrane protein TerC
MDVALVSTAVVISILLYLLMRWCLKELVLESVKLPSAAKFYLRILAVVMILVAFSATVGTSVSDNGPFMTQVWDIAKSLQGFMTAVAVVLMIYAFMITILVAHLRRRNDQ